MQKFDLKIDNSDVKIKTEQTKKISIGGETKLYPVYQIRLDALYYNDKNDRIATWISRYKSENNNKSLDTLTTAEYNDVIENFIIESNRTALEKTKNNIDLIGQQEPGVILSDGRIIDGNRRFTCLRLLHKENINKNNYFEAVILDKDFDSDEKQIKMLELAIQHGEDSKVDYNPIDRLVGIYNDIVENKLFTVEEYAQIVNDTPSSIRKKVELSNLMMEYLDFINAPKQFYIARDQDIDGPLNEIYTALKKCKTEAEKDYHKQIFFTHLVARPIPDMTRFIRSVSTDVINKESETEYLNEQLPLAEHVATVLEDAKTSNIKDTISNIRKETETISAIKQSKEKAVEKSKRIQIRNKPLELISKSLEFLNEIDYGIFGKLDSNQLEEITKCLYDIEDKIEEIRNNLKDDM